MFVIILKINKVLNQIIWKMYEYNKININNSENTVNVNVKVTENV